MRGMESFEDKVKKRRLIGVYCLFILALATLGNELVFFLGKKYYLEFGLSSTIFLNGEGSVLLGKGLTYGYSLYGLAAVLTVLCFVLGIQAKHNKVAAFKWAMVFIGLDLLAAVKLGNMTFVLFHLVMIGLIYMAWRPEVFLKK